eukprot:Seg1598.13 transcript_id=Seg1598.13/GoldUCD/mRNA.D3Y31 product="Peroxisomal multifunctional enzyme type 2" protein_id=Seg1598.13/GoldUCD/D3Y31
MMSLLRFDGRVVIITGAGRGLGREYALAFAERGAKVVVNDLGGGRDGVGKGVSQAADDVVKEIKANGGTAVANYDSVEEGENIVKTAVDNFGRVDVLVNNAGILRDRSFQKMSEQDWNLVHKVHLAGAFKVTRAAWPHFKAQNFGRIIMTSSASGLYGNFGQANYSAAKMGLIGFCNTLALEGAKYNISCNTIAPLAGSRLTEDVMPKEVFDSLQPKYVAPFVVYLCHESCDENGAVFETAAGWASRIRWQATKGVQFRKWADILTADVVKDHWAELSDWTDASPRSSMQESTMDVTASLEGLSASKSKQDNHSKTNKKLIDPSKVVGYTFEAGKFTYNAKDGILYALGIGTKVNDSSLKYLYEGNEDFSVLPTFAVMFAQQTSHDQAALYRLNGDFNPLHIDPGFASIAGFKQPILHGLCSYGFAARNVIETFAHGDVSLFRCIKARFNRPVIPGQSLITEMWKEANRVHFVVKVKETGENALTGGYVDLKGDKDGPSADTQSGGLASDVIFQEIAARVNDMPDVAKKINGVFVWKVTKDGKDAGNWVMDFKSSPPKIYQGAFDGKSDVQLTVSDDDFVAMATGQLNSQQAFFKGKLKIKGNVMLTQKLGQIFNQHAKL